MRSLKNCLNLKKDQCEDLVKQALSLILFLNEHAQLQNWFKLIKTSVKTLLNDLCR